MSKPKFDASKPFESATSKKPRFDATQPFESAELEPKTSALSAITKGAQQAAFGFGEEAQAALEKGLESVFGGGAVPLDYDKRVTELRGELAQAREERPVLTYGAELIGGLAIPVPGFGAAKSASTLQKIARATGVGAGTGALSALGASEATDLEGLVSDVAQAGTVSGLISGAIPFGGAVYSKAKNVAPKALAAVRNVSPSTIDLLARSPNKIRAIEQMGVTPQDALEQYARQTAQRTQEKIRDTISDLTRAQEEALMSADIGTRGVSASPMLEDLQASVARLSQSSNAEDRAAARALSQQMDVLVQDIDEAGMVQASKAFERKKELQRGAKKSYAAGFDEKMPLADARASAAAAIRSQLRQAVPEIAEQDDKLAQLIRAQEALGITDKVTDPASFSRILEAGSRRGAAFAPEIKALDAIAGTNLEKNAALARAVKELNAGTWLSSIPTGYSALPGVLGLSGVPVFGPAAGLAGLAISTAAAPISTRALVRGGVIVDRNVQKLSNAYQSLPESLRRRVGSGVLRQVGGAFATQLTPEVRAELLQKLEQEDEMNSVERAKLIQELQRMQ